MDRGYVGFTTHVISPDDLAKLFPEVFPRLFNEILAVTDDDQADRSLLSESVISVLDSEDWVPLEPYEVVDLLAIQPTLTGELLEASVEIDRLLLLQQDASGSVRVLLYDLLEQYIALCRKFMEWSRVDFEYLELAIQHRDSQSQLDEVSGWYFEVDRVFTRTGPGQKHRDLIHEVSYVDYVEQLL